MWLYSRKRVLVGRKFRRSLPANFSRKDCNHFSVNLEYQCPDLNIYYFRSAYFLPDSTLFLFRIWPVPFSFLFYKKRIRLHSLKGLLDIQFTWKENVLQKKEKPYLIIHDAWTTNYYHWMTQALPRLILTQKMNYDFILLLPQNHSKEFHRKSLQALGVEEWRVFDGEKNYYNVSDLIYPTHDIQIGDYHDELMGDLSRILRRGLESELQNNRRLFVHRSSGETRKIVNEAEVLAIFRCWKFEIVDFECLSFEQQGKMAAGAAVLAGVHGAGLTNMLFMSGGSKIMELTSILNGEQYYYYTLSNALGHDYYYQLCIPDSSEKSIQDANIYVDIKELNHTLMQMIGIEQ